MQARRVRHTEDLIGSMWSLTNADGSTFEPVSFGNPHEAPVQGLATKIVRVTGSSSNSVHRPLPQGASMQRCSDPALAHRALATDFLTAQAL